MRAQQLEEEANKLVEEAFNLLYMSKYVKSVAEWAGHQLNVLRVPDVIASVINAFAILVKVRPALSHLIFGALTNWTPTNIATLSSTQVKSVEKTIRLALVHLLRHVHAVPRLVQQLSLFTDPALAMRTQRRSTISCNGRTSV